MQPGHRARCMATASLHRELRRTKCERRALRYRNHSVRCLLDERKLLFFQELLYTA